MSKMLISDTSCIPGTHWHENHKFCFCDQRKHVLCKSNAVGGLPPIPFQPENIFVPDVMEHLDAYQPYNNYKLPSPNSYQHASSFEHTDFDPDQQQTFLKELEVPLPGLMKTRRTFIVPNNLDDFYDAARQPSQNPYSFPSSYQSINNMKLFPADESMDAIFRKMQSSFPSIKFNPATGAAQVRSSFVVSEGSKANVCRPDSRWIKNCHLCICNSMGNSVNCNYVGCSQGSDPGIGPVNGLKYKVLQKEVPVLY